MCIILIAQAEANYYMSGGHHALQANSTQPSEYNNWLQQAYKLGSSGWNYTLDNDIMIKLPFILICSAEANQNRKIRCPAHAEKY